MKSFANLDDRIFEQLSEQEKQEKPLQKPLQFADEMLKGKEKGNKEKEKVKEKKKRKNSSYSKWNQVDKKNFWLKNLQEMNKFPQKMHSWNHWKPDRYFHDMAKFLSTKTSSQCKSFDQRMKNQYFFSGKKTVDLPEATILSLEPYAGEDSQLNSKLEVLKKNLSRRSCQSEKEKEWETGKEEENELGLLKKEYILAVKECLEYYLGEGEMKLEELKKKIYF